MLRMLMALAAAFPILCEAAQAEPITNVNECTLITDPIALKRCIDGFQNRGPAAQYPQSPPIPPIETPAQAERQSQKKTLPPNASYTDSPEWLGNSKAIEARPPKGRVIDLDKD